MTQCFLFFSSRLQGGLDSLRTVKSPVASSMPPPCIYPFPPAAGAAIRRQADADFAGPSNQGVNSSLRHAAPTNGLAQQNHIPDLQPQPFLRSFYQFALRGVSLRTYIHSSPVLDIVLSKFYIYLIDVIALSIDWSAVNWSVVRSVDSCFIISTIGRSIDWLIGLPFIG